MPPPAKNSNATFAAVKSPVAGLNVRNSRNTARVRRSIHCLKISCATTAVVVLRLRPKLATKPPGEYVTSDSVMKSPVSDAADLYKSIYNTTNCIYCNIWLLQTCSK